MAPAPMARLGLHRFVATTFTFTHPSSACWPAHPNYFLLGFSAALAPKFHIVINEIKRNERVKRQSRRPPEGAQGPPEAPWAN